MVSNVVVGLLVHLGVVLVATKVCMSLEQPMPMVCTQVNGVFQLFQVMQLFWANISNLWAKMDDEMLEWPMLLRPFQELHSFEL
jgi:hypothetical protein